MNLKVILALCSTFMCQALEMTSAHAQLPTGDEFTFVRIRWTDNQGRYGRRYQTRVPRWAHDWPIAEEHLNAAIETMTNIKVAENRVLRFADEEIFNYPFIYACEIGYLSLSPAEVKNLREYLLRGGFLMVDDFRENQAEWGTWMRQIRQVLPEKYPLRELKVENEIFRCFFDLDEEIYTKAAYLDRLPEYYGIFDENDRMMVLINFNNDVGDGWEYDSTFDFNLLSLKLGINYLIYQFTH